MHRMQIGPIGRTGVTALVGVAAVLPFLIFQLHAAWTVPLVIEVADAAQVASDARPGSLVPGRAIVVQSLEGARRCTLGPQVRAGHGWLTAGHCSDGPARVLERTGDRAWAVAGRFERVMSPNLDLGRVRAGDGHGSSSMPFGLPVAGFREPAEGDLLCMAGSTTGVSCGWRLAEVRQHYVTADGRLIDGALLEGRVEHCVAPGDSGGPVFAVEGATATVVGVLVASTERPALGPLGPGACMVVVTTMQQASGA